MFAAKNGFLLKDNKTRSGWEIRRAEDIMLALLEYPGFATVLDDFIWEALAQAMENRKEYENIDDLANELLTNYI